MTQAPERTTTALISASLCRAAKIYAAEHGTSIRAIIEESVSEWLNDRRIRERVAQRQEQPREGGQL